MGIEQAAVFGQTSGEENPLKGLVSKEYTFPVRFKNDKKNIQCDVPFTIAGMSDKMPYKSTKFSDFTLDMLESYLETFAVKINRAVEVFQPTIIHIHHLWLISALSRVLYPEIPIVATCHNTALRQMISAPQLREYVENPIKNINKIAVIGKEQEQRVKNIYGFKPLKYDDQFLHIGQGINTDLFYPLNYNQISKDTSIPKKIVYVGKLCFSKGVPQLLEAFKEIQKERTDKLELFIIGSGDGKEHEHILDGKYKSNQSIKFLGQLDQEQLSKYLRECNVFVLPSFYDGFPKVLLESLACGCNAVITDLPGVKEELYEKLGEITNISFVPLPIMKSLDEPLKDSLPEFVSKLKKAISIQLSNNNISDDNKQYPEKIRKIYGDKALFDKYLSEYNNLIS
ncbi:MAG: glycosyltransferase family 4 protein [Candidatus Lokiarchaeota archaeon]|nr:glycosyltransferase family 4 protein [Candidatus Lokiarchaeota archaeon]